MPTILLYPSRVKMLLLFALSLGFVACNVFLVKKDDLILWAGTVFFGFCAIAFATQLMPGAAYLKITSEGFVVKSLFRTQPLVRWQDVSGFSVAIVSSHKMVVYDSNRNAKTTLGKLNRFVAGASEGLPDTYGLKAEKLAELLNRYRAARDGGRTPYS